MSRNGKRARRRDGFEVWKRLEIGHMGSVEAYLRSMDSPAQVSLRLGEPTDKIGIVCEDTPRVIKLCLITVADLVASKADADEDKAVEWDDMFNWIVKSRLEFCPPEAGLALYAQLTGEDLSSISIKSDLFSLTVVTEPPVPRVNFHDFMEILWESDGTYKEVKASSFLTALSDARCAEVPTNTLLVLCLPD